VGVLPALRVRERQRSHERGQLAIFLRPEHQMPMVGHDAPIQNANRHALMGEDHHAFKGDKIILLL